MKKPEKCRKCKYRKECNGYTMIKYNRCPQWLYNENKQKKEDVKCVQ